MAIVRKSIFDVKTGHPGDFADIIQALRDTGDEKRIKLADALEALDGTSTGIIASKAYALLANAGLPTFQNEKQWKVYAEGWFGKN